MRIPDPYFFKDVPGVGDMTMEQVIAGYDYLLLSVLKDPKGNRFLCFCFDTHGSQQWLLTPISNKDLIDLLENKLELAAPYKNEETTKIKAVMNYETREEVLTPLDAQFIPARMFPEAGEFLESDPGEWDSYIQNLRVEELKPARVEQ